MVYDQHGPRGKYRCFGTAYSLARQVRAAFYDTQARAASFAAYLDSRRDVRKAASSSTGRTGLYDHVVAPSPGLDMDMRTCPTTRWRYLFRPSRSS